MLLNREMIILRRVKDNGKMRITEFEKRHHPAIHRLVKESFLSYKLNNKIARMELSVTEKGEKVLKTF